MEIAVPEGQFTPREANQLLGQSYKLTWSMDPAKILINIIYQRKMSSRY